MEYGLRYAQGQRRALDIVSVLQPPGRRYYAFLSIVFGMVANLDRGTEHLRRACAQAGWVCLGDCQVVGHACWVVSACIAA